MPYLEQPSGGLVTVVYSGRHLSGLRNSCAPVSLFSSAYHSHVAGPKQR